MARTNMQHRQNRPIAGIAGDLRAAPLLHLPELLGEFGLDAKQILAQGGFDAALLADGERRIPYVEVGRLFDLCVRLTGCQHFGLLLGERMGVRTLGVLGDLMRSSATLRDALRLGITFLDVHDRGVLALALDFGASRVALGHALMVPDALASSQIIDASTAMLFRMLKDLCGEAWMPLQVQTSRRRPPKPAQWRRVFGAHVQFDAPLSAIVFDARWLDRPLAGADAAVHAGLLRQLEMLLPVHAQSFGAQARRAVFSMALTGNVSAARLAHLFHLHERTLRRRLAEAGTTVRELVNEVRCEIARSYLRNTDLSVAQISTALRYSDAAAFARAFRGWSKLSPREWRARHASAA